MTANLTIPISPRKQIIARHFAQASDYDAHASIQQRICQSLLTRINTHKQDSVLEVGAGSGQLTRLLANHIASQRWVINELNHTHMARLQTILPQASIVTGDAETLDLSDQHSLIVSASAVQWFDNPLSFIHQSATRLQAGGQLLFNTFTPDNFLQIKALTDQGLYYPPISAWRDALDQAGLTHIELSTKRFNVAFKHPFAVLKHMQLTGVSTNQTQTTKAAAFRWNKSRLAQFEYDYWQRFAGIDEHHQPCVYLTYEALIISAVKP